MGQILPRKLALAVLCGVLTPLEDGKWCAQINGTGYNGACLWREVAPSRLTVEDDVRVCRTSRPHAKLPEFYNKSQYDTVMEILGRWIPDGQTHVFAWTGMLRDPKTALATLSDGSHAPYSSLRSLPSEWSNATETQTQVYLLTHADTAFPDRGMGARRPTYDLMAFHVSTVLCQGT